jgi:hypothetical protein
MVVRLVGERETLVIHLGVKNVVDTLNLMFMRSQKVTALGVARKLNCVVVTSLRVFRYRL